jgi:hypothetical protein
MRATAQLATLFLALGLAPLAPILTLSYVGATWQMVVLAGVWAACWYMWLWAWIRREDQ